jgi:hypothetical protein
MKKLSLFIGLSFLLCACEEHDLGVSKETLYQKTFEDQYGPIAPGHQWGFDRAEAILNAQYEITRAIIKADMVVLPPNLHPYEVYGAAADITDREHAEVFAWFSNHKVYWTNPLTYYNGYPTNQTDDNIAHVINTSYPGYGSLTTASYNNPLGDYELNAFLDFHHAWVQHVASNENVQEVSMCPSGADDEINYITRDGQNVTYIKDTIKHDAVTANMMDYLRCWGYKDADAVDDDPVETNGGWQAHLNDDNAGHGWGYGRQEGYSNGLLVTYADIDRWTYGNSYGSSLPHDKYFIVYLKGDGYEGWYLGFDFESWGDNTEERIKCDGICNDWIIKITNVGNTILSNTVRIMCEDLGGTFDMDFNDIVYDVTYTAQHLCTITVQAAGGTLPLQMRYGNQLLEKNGQSEIHALFGANVKQPVNVAASNGVTKPAFSWVLAFNGVQSDAQYDYRIHEDLVDFSQINVYKNEEEAEWIPIGYKNGTAPYKFAVPQGTRWLKEFQNVIWGYPSFDEWVANPTIEFWNTTIPGVTINTSYLY